MVDPKKEALIVNQLQLIILGFMVSDIHRMLDEKTDEAIRWTSARHPLNHEDLDRLKVTLGLVESLYKQIEKAKEGAFFDITISQICSCPIHVEHLKKAGISTLVELQKTGPLQRRAILYDAEKASGGRRQHHLYIGMKFMMEKLAGKAEKSSPPKTGYKP